jgi:hypothetical protein
MMKKLSKSESGKLGNIKSQKTQKQRRVLLEQQYLQNPKLCKNVTCSNPLLFQDRNKKTFCSSSCSATYNNQKRIAKQKSSNNCQYCSKETNNPKFCNNTCQVSLKIQCRNERIENGQGTSGTVKSYLLDKFGNICMDPNCAWDFAKRPIDVELEHKDGNSENNKLDNCILLCPNCHSLTPTYKNKNKGNGRKSRMKRYREGKSY